MQFKTHLAIGIFAIILFFPLVNNGFVFVIITLIATVLPDIDTPFSKVGKYKFSKLTQVFTVHRGFIHSLTFCFLVSVVLAVFLPVLAFGFFLGYSIHLISDSFTKSGITPFWPYSRKAHGLITTGGVTERAVFFVFVILDIVLLGVALF